MVLFSNGGANLVKMQKINATLKAAKKMFDNM